MKAWWLGIDASDLLRAFVRTEALSDSNALRHDDQWTDLGRDRCAFVWNERPDEFRTKPTLLVAETSVLSKVLPQLMAIPGSLSPITAFCRIWNADSARLAATRKRPRPSSFVLGGFVGLLVAELYVRNGREVDFRRIGMSQVSRLFSCSISRLTLLGGDVRESDRLLAAWLDAVNITSNQVNVDYLRMVTQLVAFIHQILLSDIFDGKPTTLGAAIDGAMNPRTDLFETSTSQGGLSSLASELKPMSREARLTVIERAIENIRRSRAAEDRFIADLVCGFLLSLIDPGSVDHMDVALTLDGNVGYVAAAYCMCAGLMGGDRFLWKYDGFGLAVVASDRWKTDSFLGSSPDLCLDELKILKGRISAGGFDFRTQYPAAVEVELVPDVTGCFPNGARREASPSRIDQAVSVRLDRIDQLANELRMAVDEFRDDLRLPRTTPKRRRSQRNME